MTCLGNTHWDHATRQNGNWNKGGKSLEFSQFPLE